MGLSKFFSHDILVWVVLPILIENYTLEGLLWEIKDQKVEKKRRKRLRKM